MKPLYKCMLGLLLLLLSLPALAKRCPFDMLDIDAALVSNPSISSEDLARVKELRASGEKFHKRGRHKDSVRDLAEAKKLLGIK